MKPIPKGSNGFFSKVGDARFFYFLRIKKVPLQSLTIEAQVEQLVQPILVELELELVETQFRREQVGWVLRLIVFSKAGVTLDHCSSVSRQLGYIIEVEDVISGPYQLEVTSPGLDRPLKTRRDFERNLSEKVKVTFRHSSDTNHSIIGRITSVDKDVFVMETVDGLQTIGYNDLVKAKLVIEF